MNLTDYHAKYFAHELTNRCLSDSIEKLVNAVASAQEDLPAPREPGHVRLRSPLSKGALLAEEVSLQLAFAAHAPEVATRRTPSFSTDALAQPTAFRDLVFVH